MGAFFISSPWRCGRGAVSHNIECVQGTPKESLAEVSELQKEKTGFSLVGFMLLE